MTVTQINENQLKITLSNTEVLGCFGEYEKLNRMSDSIKASLSALLREILTDYGFTRKHCRLIAKLKIQKPIGCEITVSALQKGHFTNTKMLFEFDNLEELTIGILHLYKSNNHMPQSSLYKFDNRYRLIIKSRENSKAFFTINEFCQTKSVSPITIAYTEEYGTPLIENNAIEIYGKAFISKAF